jgi:hypothetical protein
MYKNLSDSQTPNSFNPVLANLSVGDTRHDFGYGKEKLAPVQANYNAGLPASYNEITSEEVCLNSVIKEYSNQNNEKVENSNNGSYAHTQVKYNHDITTINNYSYAISYADVKPNKELIQAKDFYSQLNMEDTEIAIVIDATSISFFEILKNGEEMANNVYYIYGPEVINDPATKKSVSSKDFTLNGGVNLIPCLPLNPSSFVYEYQFQANQDSLYLDQYFTNYQFDLSEIQENKMGKSENYLTNLTISYKDPATKEVYNNVLVDSKSKNDISFLSSILTNVIQLLVGKKSFLSGIFGSKKVDKNTNIGKNNFLMNSAFQQKRSGDWLQVLLCAALKDKSRGFYSTMDPQKRNITKNIQRVFLVTHDRIALAFALMNGIDVIFTHHQPSSHSAFVYKLNNPEEEEQQRQALAQQYQSEADKTAIETQVKELMTNLVNYQKDYYDTYVKSKITGLQTALNRYQSMVTNASSVSADTLNSQTREIFKLALSLVLFQQLLPDFTTLQKELENRNTTMSQLSSLDPMKDYKEIIAMRNELVTKIKNANTILADAKTRFENEVDIASGNEIGKTVKQFRKSITYLNASSWTWDNNLGKRQWSLLTNILDNKNYKSDRTIFLYHLSSLPDELKQKIAYLYYQYYDLIFNKKIPVQQKMKNVEAPLNTDNKAKFDAVSLSFCIEVLLTLGGNGATSANDRISTTSRASITSETIIETMNQYITSVPNPYLIDSVIVEEDIQFQEELKNNEYVGTGITTELTEDIKENEIVSPSEITNNTNTFVEPQIASNSISNKTYSNMDFNTSQATESLMTMILFTEWKKKLIPVANELVNRLKSKEQTGGAPLSQEKVQDLQQWMDLFKGSENENENEDEDEMTKTKYLPTNVFKDPTLCFHPLLPIYMISRAYYTTIQNEDIVESWDTEIYVQTFTFLQKLKEAVTKIYSGENNTNLDKVIAYVVGLGLREILFYSDSNHATTLFTKIDPKVYASMSSLLEALSYRISGKVLPNEVDEKIVESTILQKMAESIVLDNETMNSDSITNEELKERVFGFCKEVAQKMVEDRPLPQQQPVMNLSPVVSESLSSSSYEPMDIVQENPISLTGKRGREEETVNPVAYKRPYYSAPMERPGIVNDWRQPIATMGGETRKYPKKKNQKTRKSRGKQKNSKKKSKKQKRKVSKKSKKSKKHNK